MDESLAQRSGVTIGDMKSCWTRRDLIRLAIALPAGGFLAHYRALAAPHLNRVKITNVRAMAIKNIAGNCLIRIDTDAGITGYGEAGSTGPMARARIETMKPMLVGKDPLLIEVHFHNLTTLMHTYMAHIPTISGIDIALWDLAGKIIGLPGLRAAGRPVSRGHPDVLARRRTEHARQGLLPRLGAAHQANAGRLHRVQERHRSGARRARLRGLPIRSTRPPSATSARAFTNCREAVGDEIDIAVHCHNELDTPSAIGVAKAVESMNPLFMEDALQSAVFGRRGWLCADLRV